MTLTVDIRLKNRYTFAVEKVRSVSPSHTASVFPASMVWQLSLQTLWVRREFLHNLLKIVSMMIFVCNTPPAVQTTTVWVLGMINMQPIPSY